MKHRKHSSKGGRRRIRGQGVAFPKQKAAGSKLWRKVQRSGLI